MEIQRGAGSKTVNASLYQKKEVTFGTVYKKQMVDELREIENERRIRIDLERIQHVRDRREIQRQRDILEEMRKDRWREEEKNKKLALEREIQDISERNRLWNADKARKQHNRSYGLMDLNAEYENKRQEAAKSAVISPCPLHMLKTETTEPVKEGAKGAKTKLERLLGEEEEQRALVQNLHEQLNRSRQAEDRDTLKNEEEGEEIYLLEEIKREDLLLDNLSETSENTRSETPLSEAESDDILEIKEHKVEGVKVAKGAVEEASFKSVTEKSIRRRAFNWINEKVKNRNLRKIARTFKREAEEGDDPYITLASSTEFMRTRNLRTRADREKEKRSVLLKAEQTRQGIEDRWNRYQAKCTEKKEALRIREEERYERWAAKREVLFRQCIGEDEHFTEDLTKEVNSPGPTDPRPKKRMTIWQKRILRLNVVDE